MAQSDNGKNFKIEITQQKVPKNLETELEGQGYKLKEINEIRETQEKRVAKPNKNQGKTEPYITNWLAGEMKKQEAPNLPLNARWADLVYDKQIVEERAKKNGVTVTFDENDLPVNNFQTGLEHVRTLGKYGPNFAADMVPIIIKDDNTASEDISEEQASEFKITGYTEYEDAINPISQLVIQRGDGTGLAMPGGFIDPEDDSAGLGQNKIQVNSGKTASARELVEECFRKLTWGDKNKLHQELKQTSISNNKFLDNGDGRNTNINWMMTTVCVAILSDYFASKVKAGDDAKDAAFMPITSKLYDSMKFASHGMLNMMLWKVTEEKILNELASRLEAKTIRNDTVVNALRQLKTMREDMIEKNLQGTENQKTIYGDEKMPELSFNAIKEKAKEKQIKDFLSRNYALNKKDGLFVERSSGLNLNTNSPTPTKKSSHSDDLIISILKSVALDKSGDKLTIFSNKRYEMLDEQGVNIIDSVLKSVQKGRDGKYMVKEDCGNENAERAKILCEHLNENMDKHKGIVAMRDMLESSVKKDKESGLFVPKEDCSDDKIAHVERYCAKLNYISRCNENNHLG
jgi:hypothetical protein